MNCQDFEAIIIEIARDRPMDAVARERGLEHIHRCAPCAMLLVEERALSRDLHALSAHVAAEEIPARIETALLSAFRQQAAAPIASPAGSIRRRRWLLAVAALALLTFGLSLAGWMTSSTKPGPAAHGSTDNGGAPAVGPSEAHDKTDQAPPRIETVRQLDRSVAGSFIAKRQKRFQLASAGRQSAVNGDSREFVTQFFPVMQGGELIPLESGQIVRVRMPRSNLIPLG